MGPKNAVMGDSTNYGTDLPNTEVPDEQMAELQKSAKFSKTKEFQVLKDHLEGRVAYYQSFLPGNVPAENVPDDERGKYWAIANILIAEFRGIINSYEQAAQEIKDAASRQKTA